jgi:hypothetical protein
LIPSTFKNEMIKEEEEKEKKKKRERMMKQ